MKLRDIKEQTPEQMFEQDRITLMGRCARMIRLEKLGAPQQILTNEASLITKALVNMRPRDIAQAMHDFPSFVARVERAVKEAEDENPMPVEDKWDWLLDPDTPEAMVDDELFSLGLNPEKLRKDGLTFVRSLFVCDSCGRDRPHVHVDACDGAHRCKQVDGALRCCKWEGHFAKKNPHVMV